ncbi:LysR family transcriptional regulator [Microbacterium sp. G2-8]|uniref:LysR family transcriptional regulator n=1 Tax=Microbacterium sp. G2-8 TaxID=2842454 RepID=UPI001C89F823|nr:LysR family transcriptional regulator [Microbacterium sp. G2-8]
MKNVTLRQMEYLVSVVDHGSVGAGAAACHVSQATVSASIAQLEKALGADLLVRGPARRAHATQAGLDFAARAREILGAVTEAADAVDDSREGLRGPLSVGCTHTAGPRFLPSLADLVTRSWPDVQLSLVEGAPRDIQRSVSEGRLDIGIVYSRQVRGTDLEQHHLIDVDLHAMLPADSPLARRDEVSLYDLVDMPAVMLDVPPTQELLLERINAHGLDIDVRWRSSSAETMRSLVARGLGFGFVNAVPHPSLRSFEGMEVAYRRVEERIFDNAAVALTPVGRHRLRRVDAAIEALRQIAADSDPRAW